MRARRTWTTAVTTCLARTKRRRGTRLWTRTSVKCSRGQDQDDVRRFCSQASQDPEAAVRHWIPRAGRSSRRRIAIAQRMCCMSVTGAGERCARTWPITVATRVLLDGRPGIKRAACARWDLRARSQEGGSTSMETTYSTRTTAPRAEQTMEGAYAEGRRRER